MFKLNKITNFLDTHPIGRVFKLGQNKAVWKRVSELTAGVKIAIEKDGKLQWDEIVEIKSVGRERVYDIEVAGTHNFVANGIIAHNTYISGNVGIGTTAPTQKLDVNGYVRGQRFEDSTSATYYVDPGNSTGLYTAGNIVSDSSTFTIQTLSTNSIFLVAGTAGGGNVSIGTSGAGKLDAGTIDPPYTIDGGKYATYMAGMTGVKEETTGVVSTNEYVSGVGYRNVIDFNQALTGSDLWLFSKTTNLKENSDKIVVLLSPTTNTKAWYSFDEFGKLSIFTSRPAIVSYRLTAPRFDSANWENTRTGGGEGFVVNSSDSNVWKTLADNINNIVEPILENFQGIISPIIQTKLISPLADSDTVTIQTKNLVVENASGSAELKIIGDLTAENASISGELYAGKLSSPELDKIQELLRQVKEDQDLLAQAQTWQTNTATSSASLTAIANITDLYVTGQAAISSLSVSNSLSLGTDFVIQASDSSLNTLSAPLKLQSLAMAPVEIMAGKFRIETNGNVAINADLFVAGKIEAESLRAKEVTTEKLVIAMEATPSAMLEATSSAVINTNSTAGKAVIPAGLSEITINNTNISDYTLVYVTPTSSTENNVLYVKSKEVGKFVVGFTNPTDIDVTFNWWIIETR